MRVKVRNVMHAVRDRYAFGIEEFSVYTGQSLPVPKWAVPGTLCLTTGDPRWPMRMLHPDSIVEVDGVSKTADQ